MTEIFSRTELLLGSDGILRLSRAKVAIFGIGGVGGYVAEALARAGVGCLHLIDPDTVCVSNINRQIVALHSTVGRFKAEVMEERILEINPKADVRVFTVFYGADTAARFDFREYDYIVDAIDTVTSKLLLIETAKRAGVPVISSMGAGNKLDPSRFEVCDIKKTLVCPLARVMRRELKARGIESLKVVYSKEAPIKTEIPPKELPPGKRQVPGSISFVPPAAGLLLAGEVVRDILKKA